jgi:hypothetical protein
MGRLIQASALIAIALVLGGGAYALGSSSAGTITACVSHKDGTLYRASTCRAHDKTLTWNQQGPIGPRGPRGLKGPQGPGATSFATTINQGAPPRTLDKLANGVTLAGSCFNSSVGIVELDLEVASGTLQISGTDSLGTSVGTADFDGPGGGIGLQSTTTVDWDVVARDATLNRGFARIDAHAEFGSPCRFWAMITPSSLK